MSIFIDCLVNNELEKLIIEGTPTEKELSDCFDSLYMQYTEEAGGLQAKKKLMKTRQLTQLQNRVKMFGLLIEVINILPTKENFEFLYSFNEYLPERMEFSEDNLKKVINSMIPHWKSEYVDLMNELDKIKLSNPSGKESHYTYEYFASTITEMESVFKTVIPENITVGKYCSWIAKYKAYARRLEIEKLNGK